MQKYRELVAKVRPDIKWQMQTGYTIYKLNSQKMAVDGNFLMDNVSV